MSGSKRIDPEDDPFACNLCGGYLGELQRVRGDDHCEHCKREFGFGVDTQ